MIKTARMEKMIEAIKGKLPGQDNEPNAGLRSAVGATAGAAAGALPVAMGHSKHLPAMGSMLGDMSRSPVMDLLRQVKSQPGELQLEALPKSVDRAKKLIGGLLAAKRNPGKLIGGLAAAGGAAGLGSALLSKNSEYLEGFVKQCEMAGMNEEQIKKALNLSSGARAARAALSGAVSKVKGIGESSLGKAYTAGRQGTGEFEKLLSRPVGGLAAGAAEATPSILNRAAHGLGAGVTRFGQTAVGQGLGNAAGAGRRAAGAIHRDLKPLLDWAKQHPMYAGGTGLGAVSAGGGLQSLINGGDNTGAY